MSYQVKVTVHEVTKGECPRGVKVGDSWVIGKDGTPAGMCTSAYNAVAPATRVFRFGGEHPWDEDKDVTYISCPDPKHWVIYEVRRLR
ncbi:MAG: TIGR04076 family protein [Chloroflexota bacterium]